MTMEANLRSKVLYKLLLVTIKYIPIVISFCYVLNTILALAEIDFPILSMLAGMSILTWIFMYLATVVFRFCNYHKMFLWYILTDDIISTLDYYIDLPIDDFQILAIHSTIIGIFLFIILYLYAKNNKKSIRKDS